MEVKRKVKIINCDGFDIASTIEGDEGEECPIYFPANCLVYVECGRLNLYIEDEIVTIQRDEFVFVRKYSYGKYKKFIDQDRGKFREHIFILNDVFIQEVVKDFELQEKNIPSEKTIFPLPKNPILKGLMKSIEIYINERTQVDRRLIQMKTKEALYALTHLRPELSAIFSEFSSPGKADLELFMEYNYMHNISLDRFAQLSGRSLSSFNREFRRLFKTTPHKWIRARRLELAKKLLTETRKNPIDVYLEVGFKDLAHFSRSFKQYFGINPSEVK